MTRLAAIVLAFLVLCTGVPARAQAGQASQPKLVLLLVIDQFSYDYLSRYQGLFGAGGFRYLLEHGASFTGCRYKQAATLTAVGHSVIATGAYPWSTGIVGNEWWDRRKEKAVTPVGDESVQMVGGNGAGASARLMHGTTLGDELKLATNGRSKVIAVSLKDRAALLLAGRLASWAFWWDQRTGSFVSSSQFGSALPAWAKAFNDTHYADRYFAKPWQRLLGEGAYTASTRDDYAYEEMLPGDGRSFPHVISGGVGAPAEPFYRTFAMTPWANQMLADFARECIERENLGSPAHADTDLLAVSFSASDYLGHGYGPYSQEVEDLFLRLDQTLAGLLQFVDQKVGLNRCLIVLTGDHGVMPVPEFLRERGMDAGRIDPGAFRQLLDQAMDARLGADDWVSAFEPPNLYLNLSAIDRQKYRQSEVEALAAKLSRGIQGVGEVYTAAQFFANQVPAGPAAEAVKRSYYWGRSGELYVVPRPGYVFKNDLVGTTHGSPWSYDTQVPLVLCGTTVRAGRYGCEASPADIAPTVASILNIAMPSLAEGRVLTEALEQICGPPCPRLAAPPATAAGGSAERVPRLPGSP